MLSAFDILGLCGLTSRTTGGSTGVDGWELVAVLEGERADPADTMVEVADEGGLVVVGGFEGDTGTESDPVAPAGEADINQCILQLEALR